MDDLRKKAETLIEAGRTQGYPAYADGRVIGWCNAGPKASFKRLFADEGAGFTPVKALSHGTVMQRAV